MARVAKIPTNENGAVPISVGFGITGFDYIALTYVASGDGVGEIETVTYKSGGSGGTVLGTLTLTYNASNEIASVTKS